MAIPSSTEYIEDIVSTTIRNIRPKVIDNFFKSKALFVRLMEKNRVMLDGGRQIQQPFLYDAPPGGSYGRGDDLDISTKNILSSMIFDWSRYYSAVTIDGLDELQNAGAQKIIDLTEVRMNAARMKIEDDIGGDIFLDGTGNGSKNIVGLRAGIDDGNTVASYGGITRVVSAAVGTPAYAVNAGYVSTTAATFTPDIATTAMGGATVSGERPDLIITTQAIWDRFHDRLQTQQRFPSTSTPGAKGMIDAGFPAFSWSGAEVVVDQKCPTGFMYFLNTKYITLYVHSMRNFVVDGPHVPANRDQRTWRVFFAGCLVIGAPRLQALVSNLT